MPIVARNKTINEVEYSKIEKIYEISLSLNSTFQSISQIGNFYNYCFRIPVRNQEYLVIKMMVDKLAAMKVKLLDLPFPGISMSRHCRMFGILRLCVGFSYQSKISLDLKVAGALVFIVFIVVLSFT